MAALSTLTRLQLALIGIALAVVLFVAVNVLAQLTLTTNRLDLTEEGLFTLTNSTERVLQNIDEPVDLRFYYSRELDDLGPRIKTHAERVDELLETYRRLSDGKVRIERLDPEPFSATEDLAVAEGIEGIPVDVDGTLAYFGLSGRNSTDDLEVISYLAPERSEFLEYDLTRLVFDLANPNKPVVAVLGDLPLMGSQANQFQSWLVVEAMFQFFDIRFLGGSQEEIAEEVEVLLLTQPLSLDETGLYAVDQFVMRGGKVVAFIDPYAEVMAGTGTVPGTPEANAIEVIEPLLEAWGVTMPEDQVVGDGRLAERVSARIRGRDAIVAYLPWIALDRNALAGNDVVTADLERISLRSAGWIEPAEGASTTLTPLLTSSADVMPLEVADLEGQPDLSELISSFAPRGEPYVIGARITGPVSSAFPDGPPVEDAGDREAFDSHISEAESPLNLVLIADTDILADQTWLQQQSMLGQNVVVPIANNADFAVNLVDNLTGSEGLIDLRGRGLSVRPFEVVQDMQRQAEFQFRAKEEELLQRIAETEAEIAQLQQQDDGANGVIPTTAQEEEIEAFRAEMIRLRGELREVQRSLRADVESLSFRLQAVNIAAIPLLIALVAVGLAVARWLRNRRRVATA